MVRPRRLVRAAPPQLSFRPAGGYYWTSIGGSLLDADQHICLSITYRPMVRANNERPGCSFKAQQIFLSVAGIQKNNSTY